MEKVDISKDFTVEDIHKIREAHYERTKIGLQIKSMRKSVNLHCESRRKSSPFAKSERSTGHQCLRSKT